MHVTEPSRWLLLRQKPFHTFEHVGEGVELGPMFPYNTSITFLVNISGVHSECVSVQACCYQKISLLNKFYVEIKVASLDFLL